MNQSVFDIKQNALFRDRVKDFLVDCLDQKQSMAEAHYHPYYELFYVVKGSCRMFVGHKLYAVNEGELVILPPSALHRTQYETEAQRITVSFTPKYIETMKSILGEDFLSKYITPGKLHFTENKKKEIEAFLTELLNKYEKSLEDLLNSIDLKTLLIQLLVFIARNTEFKCKNELMDKRTESIQNAAKYIFENYGKDISLQEAADIAGIRDTYFSRLFQEITGYGFKEYLLNIRIQHAQEMLRAGKLKITQIALACGFSDGNYFGDIFKKRTGLSPREFRRLQVKQNFLP